MKEFNIKDIEIKEESPVEIPELLTGEVIKGLDPKSPVSQNSELERGEFIQFPDGLTQKVVGKDHEKGGVKMNIPNGTKVVSNNLKLTKDQVKKLSKDFELDLSTKDTYAEAIEKYTRKIGLKKLNDEQEDAFTELEKLLKKEMAPNTLKVNREFLSEKINNIEEKKKPVEKDRADFFNVIFDMQEVANPVKPEQQKMEDGGVRFYQDGGEEPFSGVFNVSDGRHNYSNEAQYQRQKQARNNAAFGNINSEADINNVLQQLYENFPDIILDQEVFGKNIKIENGKVVFDKKLNFSKKIEQVKNFQEKANDRMNASADLIVANPDTFGKDAVESANKFKETQTFNQSIARGFDSALGNFTSGRYNIGLDVLSPEEKSKLSGQGIYTINQLKSADLNTLGLSDKTLQRVNKVLEIQKSNPKSDYRLDTYLGENKPAEIIVPEKTIETVSGTNPNGTPIVNKVIAPRGAEYPKMFFQPDQSVLPPSALEANLKVDTRLQRIDPIRIGVEQTLQELSDQKNFVTDQLGQIPDSQRASALANLLATSQSNANKAITQANVVNAQNQSQAELFNINQATQEGLYNANNALSFEQRQMTGKAKTDEELRRYYDFNRKVNINNFQNNQRLNMLDSLFPELTIDPFGMQVVYDENAQPIPIQNRSAYLDIFSNNLPK